MSRWLRTGSPQFDSSAGRTSERVDARPPWLVLTPDLPVRSAGSTVGIDLERSHAVARVTNLAIESGGTLGSGTEGP
jgi:hypothetical protein